jgi:ubiquinone biosynthesis protein UbiJ
MVDDGVAPSIFGLLERGIERRPELAAQIRGRVVFRFAEDFSPLRIAFKPKTVVLEDGDLRKPDLVIAGSLPDIVHLLTVPTLTGRLGGLPTPRKPRGREALARIASGRVKIDGDTAFGLKLLQLLAV